MVLLCGGLDTPHNTVTTLTEVKHPLNIAPCYNICNNVKMTNIHSINNMTNRHLLNLLLLTEHYKADGIYYGYLGRKTTTQLEKELLQVHVPYPDIDFCIRTKTWISYDPNEKQLYLSDGLKYGKNHWLSTLKDDIKNSRIDPMDFAHGNYRKK